MAKARTLKETLEYLGAIASGQSLPTVNGRNLRSVTKYIAGQAVDLASNNGQALLPSTLKKVGTTNFVDGNKLPAGIDFLVHEIRVVYETTATDLNLATWKSAAPVSFKNGELTIQQDGGGVLFSSCGTDITNSAASTSNDDDFKSVVPFKLRSQIPFSILFANAGTVVAGMYKVELRGEEIVPVAQA